MSTVGNDSPATQLGTSLLLWEVQRLPTSGARAVEPFTVDGVQYLAVPQLAMDHPGQTPAITAGNSDVDLIVYRRDDGQFVEHQRLPVAGGEDAEFFSIGGRRFLATASLRCGSGPYEMRISSTVFEWVGDQFLPFQHFETFAAKQWTHFEIDGRHFLALAQGALLPGKTGENRKSVIFHWTGERFEPLQEVESAWGYNWLHFKVGDDHFLAYADHSEPSVILRWNGESFETFQILGSDSGRAFCAFEAQGEHWLAFANLHADTVLYRWDGISFTEHQVLSGPGGREFELLPGKPRREPYLVQVNFIHGSREAPRPRLTSYIHAWRDERLEIVDQFQTSGGTDAATFTVDGKRYLAVSNSLAEDVRFRTDTLIYEVLEG